MPTATVVKVVDASALASVIFAEPEGLDVRRRLAGCQLAAPTLLPFEIANVCLTKIRRSPDLRDGLLERLALREASAIKLHEVDEREVLLCAEANRLSAYDASYLWLARHLNAELVTLDKRLAAAAG